MTYYIDTSALTKRYVSEIGSQIIIEICLSSSPITTVSLTHVEAAAALARKHRSGGLNMVDYRQALENLEYDFDSQYLQIDVDQNVIDIAIDLTKSHKLRGYDAMQLAAALTIRELISDNNDTFIFVAADNDLLDAAREEGLSTLNPLETI